MGAAAVHGRDRRGTGGGSGGAGDLERYRAIEARQKQLVAECEKQPGRRCRVAVFDDGVQYVLVESLEFTDVRLVYAPPRAVGEYGGETDNWMWPRHAGDFAIARACAGGAPCRPEFHFPISGRGASPGDFVMVLGYPVETFRSLLAEEMAERRDQFYPRRVRLYGEFIRVLTEAARGSAEGTIAVAAALKNLQNRYKNAQGQIAGLRRGRIVEKQRASEEAVAAWAQGRSEHREALEARAALLALLAEQRQSWERDFLLRELPQGPRALHLATRLVRLAGERQKPDLEREPEYMERNLARLREEVEREQKNYFAAADKRLLRAVASLFGGLSEARIEALYAGTKVMDLGERMKMFAESPAQLRARRDPLLELAFALDEELRALKQREQAWKGRLYRLRPQWRRAVLAHAGKPVAPDANGALRVSFAHVKGYEPRDGVIYKPQTTLAGVLEKHTGEEPFNAPETLRAAFAARPATCP